MTVVVDTSVLVAAFNERDARHARAREIMEEIRQARHGDAPVERQRGTRGT